MKRTEFSTAIVGKAAIGAVTTYVAICSLVAMHLTRPKRVPFDQSPDHFGLSFEHVSFRSRLDGIPLDGWLLLPPSDLPWRRPVVTVHGMGCDRQHEAGGRVLEVVAALVKRGRPVLMFDLRGCGYSGGSRFTLGAHEVRDVGGAIDFLASRGMASNGVNLLGYSMGASTAMLSAASDPLVRTVAEDSGFADLNGLLECQLPKRSGLPRLFTPGVLFAARALLGLDARSIRPIDQIPWLAVRKIPLMVIHGEDDTMVPADHGRRVAAAYGPGAEALFVPDAEHVESYAASPAAYLARLIAFFDRHE